MHMPHRAAEVAQNDESLALSQATFALQVPSLLPQSLKPAVHPAGTTKYVPSPRQVTLPVPSYPASVISVQEAAGAVAAEQSIVSTPTRVVRDGGLVDGAKAVASATNVVMVGSHGMFRMHVPALPMSLWVVLHVGGATVYIPSARHVTLPPV